MKTKLDYYKIFYETALHSSFSAAAKNLFISQSAISQCISQLEEDLNTCLFIRSRRGISLTKEGLLLLSKVENAIKSIEEGETLLAQLHHLDSGSLIIAAGDTITKHFLLPYLEKFHRLYPGIRIEMTNSYSSRLLQSVKEGKAELAFINMPLTDEELTIRPCFTIHDIFVCGAEYDTKNEYTLSEIAKEPLILLEANSASRNYIDNFFAKNQLTLVPEIELAVHDLLVQFAAIHLGVSCVIKEFSLEALKSGAIKEMNLTTPLPERSIGYAHLKHNPISLPAKAFLSLISEK